MTRDADAPIGDYVHVEVLVEGGHGLVRLRLAAASTDVALPPLLTADQAEQIADELLRGARYTRELVGAAALEPRPPREAVDEAIRYAALQRAARPIHLCNLAAEVKAARAEEATLQAFASSAGWDTPLQYVEALCKHNTALSMELDIVEATLNRVRAVPEQLRSVLLRLFGQEPLPSSSHFIGCVQQAIEDALAEPAAAKPDAG